MPAGRPHKLSAAGIKKIAELFWLAFTDQQIAEFVGLNERTIRRYRAGQLCPAIKKAEIELEIPYRKKIWASGPNWCGAAWFLERKYPTQFAKPEIQLNWSNSYTQNNLTLSISSAEARTIEKEAAPIRDAVSSMFQKYRPALGNGNGHQTTDDKSS